jgi:hypothetical protein
LQGTAQWLRIDAAWGGTKVSASPSAIAPNIQPLPPFDNGFTKEENHSSTLENILNKAKGCHTGKIYFKLRTEKNEHFALLDLCRVGDGDSDLVQGHCHAEAQRAKEQGKKLSPKSLSGRIFRKTSSLRSEFV